jgi:hypothetical protein
MSWEDDSAPEDTALWVRYVRIAKDAVLRHIVLVKGSDKLKADYLALEALEAENPLQTEPGQ